MSEYKTVLAQLQAAAQRLSFACKSVGDAEGAARCSRLAVKMVPRRFRLAVVGEFKAGKSTLINALVAQEILPSATRECTAVVTCIRGTSLNEAPGAKVILANGTTKNVSVNELPELLTVAGQGVGSKEVREAEVRINGMHWMGLDVELVDTPGLNAAFLQRAQTTLNFLPSADAIIFVTRADQAFPDSEVAFLTENLSADEVAKVFFVANRADMIHGERDRIEVAARANQVIQRVLPGSTVGVFFTSAVAAIDAIHDSDPVLASSSGVQALKDSLTQFLSEERFPAELARHNRMIHALAAQVHRNLSSRIEDQTLTGQQLEQRKQRTKELIRLALQDESELKEHITAAFAGLRDQLLATAEARVRGLRGDLASIEADTEYEARSRVRGTVERSMLAGLSQINSELSNGVRRISADACTRLRSVIGRNDAAISGAPVLAEVGLTNLSEAVTVYSTEKLLPAESNNGRAIGAFAGVGVGLAIAAALPIVGLAALAAAVFLGATGYQAGSEIGSAASAGKRAKSVAKVNAGSADRAMGDEFSRATKEAVKSSMNQTINSVVAIIRSKVAELEKRVDDLNSGGRTSNQPVQAELEAARTVAMNVMHGAAESGLATAITAPATAQRPRPNERILGETR